MTQVLVKCLCAALIPCVAPAVAATSAPARVALFLDFDRSPDSRVVNSMESEVQRILIPSGLRVEWHLLPEQAPGSDFRALAVVHVKGSCSVPSFPAALDGAPGEALASTQVTDGHVLPFTDLQCSRIGEYISPLLSGASQPARDQVLGRAMGRILAHELYHIFTGTQKHADGGIARSYHRRQELVERKFDFQQAENEKFRDFRASIDSSPSQPDAGIPSETPDDSLSSAGR